MEYNKLGRTGLPVSSIGFGAMNLDTLEKSMAFSILDKAHDLGINLIDTSSGYANSEKILGEWFAKSEARDEFVINTKVGWPTGTGVFDRGVNHKHITRQLKKSLSDLQTDYIDIYQLHSYDHDQDLLPLVRLFHNFVENQQIGIIGAPTFSRMYNVVAWYFLAKQHGLHAIGSKLLTTSLLSRAMYDGDTRPFASEYGLGLITFGSLGGGLLTGKYHSKEPFPENGRDMARRVISNNNIDGLIERLREISREMDISVAKLSFAWVLHHDFMSSTIIGATNPDQLEDIVSTQEINLSDDVFKELMSLSNQYKIW